MESEPGEYAPDRDESRSGADVGQLDEAAQCVREAHLLDRAAVDLQEARRADEVGGHRAREIATFSRLREKRNSSPRGASSPLELAIE